MGYGGRSDFFNELHSWEWLGILMARIAVGLLFFLSGRGKLFVAERRQQVRQTLIAARIPFPDLNTLFVSTVEFVCGLLLVFGALTPLACAFLGCVMIMAIATTAIPSIKAASPLNWLSDGKRSAYPTTAGAESLSKFIYWLRLALWDLAAGQSPLTLAAKWQCKQFAQRQLVFIAIGSDTNSNGVLWNIAAQRAMELVPPAKNRAKV